MQALAMGAAETERYTSQQSKLQVATEGIHRMQQEAPAFLGTHPCSQVSSQSPQQGHQIGGAYCISEDVVSPTSIIPSITLSTRYQEGWESS